MNESTNRKLGAILSYVSIIASTLIQLLYTPFLIRQLGQSEYGLYSLVNSIVGYLTVLDLGFGNAIVVYTSKYRAQKKYEEEKKLHGMFALIFTIIGLIAGVIGLILYFNVDNLFGNTMTSLELHKAKIMMLILTFNLVISFVFSIYSSILNAYEKFVYQKILSILGTILKPLIMIPLLFMGLKSVTMVIVITLVNVLILLSNYLYCRRKLKIKIKFMGFDFSLFKVILSYSIWIFLGIIVDKINWSIDQFILGAVVGTIAVSVYAVASQINTLFVGLSTAISSVLLPKISKMIAKNATTKELTAEFIKVGRLQFYVVFLMTSGLVLFGKEFIIWWVGKKYIDSYYCALLLILPVSIPLIQNLGISIRQALNKHRFAIITNIVVALINFICSIFLAKYYGAIGSALGTGIGMIVSIIIINLYYQFYLKLNMVLFWKNIIKMLIVCLLPVSIIWIIIYLTKLEGIISLLVYGSIYTIIYLITIYFTLMNNYEKGIADKFIGKFRRLV